MGRPRHTPPKKKTVKERIFTTIVVAAFIATIVGMIVFISKHVKQPEEYFVKYENATTLVVVKYGEQSFWGYPGAVGFMDDDIYEKYQNNEYTEGKIEIYHPYKRGESIMVDVDEIVSITTKTYRSFYSSYPPR